MGRINLRSHFFCLSLSTLAMNDDFTNPFTLPGLPSTRVHSQNEDQSPTKRRKVELELPPLRPLPQPLALLTIATSLRQSTQKLLPLLSKPPSSQNSHLRYHKNWSDYYRLSTSSIVCLRTAVEVCQRSSTEWKGTRIELRLNASLAEQLADLYEGTENVQDAVNEAEKYIVRAVRVLIYFSHSIAK